MIQLVSKGLKFLSVVVKMGTRRQMFENPDTLRMFCEKIILPNMIIRRKPKSNIWTNVALTDRARGGDVRGRSE